MSCVVILDHETVKFDGPQPPTVEAVLCFLEQFLNTSGKTFATIKVNDHLILPEDLPKSIDNIDSISCQSKNYDSLKLRQVFEALKSKIPSNTKILTSDWEKILEISKTFMQYLRSFLKVLQEECLWIFIQEERLYEQWMQTYLDCIERKDIGTLFDCIEFTLRPLVFYDSTKLMLPYSLQKLP